MENINLPTAEDVKADLKPKPTSFFMGWLIALIFLGIQIGVMAVLAIIGVIRYGFLKYEMADLQDNMDAVMEDTLQFAIKLAIPMAFGLGAFILYKWRGLADYAFQWKKNFLLLIPIGFLMVLGISHVVGEFLTYMPGYEASLEQYKAMFEGIDPTALLIGGAFIGPICEEIIFRGIILEGFLRKYDVKRAILFSAIIFGVIHLQPLQVVGAFFSGLVLGWIYYKTRSLWVCIGVHIINNLIAFTFEDVGTESMKETFSNDFVYAGSFAVVVLLAYLAYMAFNKINEANEVSAVRP